MISPKALIAWRKYGHKSNYKIFLFACFQYKETAEFQASFSGFIYSTGMSTIDFLECW